MNIIMHIDVNNAFLSWSAVLYLKSGFKYDIRNEYAVIGGSEKTRSGIVLAKSMSAKKKGVVSGETLYSAKKKCPNLKVYPPDYKFYNKMSYKMFEILYKYSPDIEPMSIDEGFLDFTPIKHIYKNELVFAEKIKKEINDTLGFTVNIGIANNKLCAKMASNFSKPNKIHTLYSNEIEEKMWHLSIEELFGIGKSTSKKLRELNINTIYDLAHADVYILKKYFKNQAKIMIEHANGIDDTPVNSILEEVKGIGNSTTLPRDYHSKEEIYPVLEELCENVAINLRKQKRYANVVSVQLKDNNFKSVSHQKKLLNPVHTTSEVYNISKKLLDEMWENKAIRLVGVRLDNLTDNFSHQISLFEKDDEKDKNSKLEYIVDDLKKKYGNKVINKASLTKKQIKKKY